MEEVVWIWKVKVKDMNFGREVYLDNEFFLVEGFGEGEFKGGVFW